MIRRPLNNIYLVATSAMDLFCSLDAVDRITLSGTDASGWYIREARQAIESGAMSYAGKYNAPDYELIDLGFSDFTDAYTMAGYVLSDDVEFAGLSAEEAKAVLEYRSTLTLEQLTEIFNNADFPLASADKWPESFSYEKRGTVCFSLPVPHALGDYVIVTFDRSGTHSACLMSFRLTRTRPRTSC